jgi:hypothetical protein
MAKASVAVAASSSTMKLTTKRVEIKNGVTHNDGDDG